MQPGAQAAFSQAALSMWINMHIMAEVRGSRDASWLDLAAPSLARCLPFVLSDTTTTELTIPVLCKLIIWLGRGCRTITARLAKPPGSMGEMNAELTCSSSSSKRSSSSSNGSSSRGAGTSSSSSSSSSAAEKSRGAGAAPATPCDLTVNPGWRCGSWWKLPLPAQLTRTPCGCH